MQIYHVSLGYTTKNIQQLYCLQNVTCFKTNETILWGLHLDLCTFFEITILWYLHCLLFIFILWSSHCTAVQCWSWKHLIPDISLHLGMTKFPPHFHVTTGIYLQSMSLQYNQSIQGRCECKQVNKHMLSTQTSPEL